MGKKVTEGSIEKYSIEMDPIGVSTLKSSSWEIKVWARKSIVIKKTDAVYVNDNKYFFYVDTSLIGKGRIRMKLLISLIDYDYNTGNNQRPVEPEWDTGDIVV